MQFSHIVLSVVCASIITIQIVCSIKNQLSASGYPADTRSQDHGTMVLLSNYGDEKDETEKGSMPEDQHTFVVLLDIVNSDGTSKTCTGAVIHDNVVISAAHCFRSTSDFESEPELTASFVVLGTKKQYDTGYEQYLPIEKVVIHPRYKVWTADLALVFTFAGMMSDKPGQVIPLAGEKSTNPVDSNVTVLSWGRCSDKDQADEDEKEISKPRTVLKTFDNFKDPRNILRDDRAREQEREIERVQEREREMETDRPRERERLKDSYRDTEKDLDRVRAWDRERKAREESPINEHLSGYEVRRDSPKNRFHIMTGVKDEIPGEPSPPIEMAPRQTTSAISRYLPKSAEILRETQLRVNNAANVKTIMAESEYNPPPPEESMKKSIRGTAYKTDTKRFGDINDRLRTLEKTHISDVSDSDSTSNENQNPKLRGRDLETSSTNPVVDDPSKNVREQALETIIMTHAKSGLLKEKSYTSAHRSRKQFKKQYPRPPVRYRDVDWRRKYNTQNPQNGPDPEEIERLLEDSKKDTSIPTATPRNEIEEYKAFKNSRRKMGPQRNELTVESFGLVNLQTCKKLIDKAKPMNTLENINEVLCFSSEDHYITYEDSGAPVMQNGELVAVTIAGIEVEGEHVAIGMKINCFCHWVAENLPNHSGDTIKCCKNCCGGEERRLRQGLKKAQSAESSKEEFMEKEREILEKIRSQMS